MVDVRPPSIFFFLHCYIYVEILTDSQKFNIIISKLLKPSKRKIVPNTYIVTFMSMIDSRCHIYKYYYFNTFLNTQMQEFGNRFNDVFGNELHPSLSITDRILLYSKRLTTLKKFQPSYERKFWVRHYSYFCFKLLKLI